MSALNIYIVVTFLILSVILGICVSESLNNRPIIGILAQETAYSLEQIYPREFKSFIAASYVKLMEGAGARVVPIWIGRDERYYKEMVNKTNGVLFPGGSSIFNRRNGYAEAGTEIYKMAVKANIHGEVYPILGICLGFELIMYVAANGVEYRERCEAENIALPLEFKPDFQKSKMFGNAPDYIINLFKTKNVAPNFHQFCVTERSLDKLKILKDWKVLSVNNDMKGLEFISTMESKKYPFFGLQFHPEKNIYEWKHKQGIVHTRESVISSQYLADMFVNIARKSKHKFDDKKEEQNALIWNYPITYTGLQGNSYEQCYLFR